MANNFKSKEVYWTGDASKTLITADVPAVIINSITFQFQAGSSITSGYVRLSLTKFGGSARQIYNLKTSDIQAETATQLIDKSLVLNNGDVLSVSIGGLSGQAVVAMSYLEKTADLTTSELSDLTDVSLANPAEGQILVYDSASGLYVPTTIGTISDISTTEDLPQQSTGTEPFNRYMKGFNGLDELTNATSDSAAETLYSSPTAVKFVVENTDLTTVKPMKVSFNDIIQAIVSVGANDLVAAGIGDATTYTGTGGFGDLDDSGDVGVADLLLFLGAYGEAWGDANSTIFQKSTIEFTDSDDKVISGDTAAVVGFDVADVTVDAGTQTVTVDATNDLIKIASQSVNQSLHEIPNKKLVFKATNFFSASTTVEGEQIFWSAEIKLFDNTDTQIGSTWEPPLTNGQFTFAESYTGQGNFELSFDDAQFANATGDADHWNGSDFEYLTIKIKARAASTQPATVSIDNLTVILRQ